MCTALRDYLILERNNSSIIGINNILSDLIRFQYFGEGLNAFVIFIAFLYNKHIYIGLCCNRIAGFICYCIMGN